MLGKLNWAEAGLGSSKPPHSNAITDADFNNALVVAPCIAISPGSLLPAPRAVFGFCPKHGFFAIDGAGVGTSTKLLRWRLFSQDTHTQGAQGFPNKRREIAPGHLRPYHREQQLPWQHLARQCKPERS